MLVPLFLTLFVQPAAILLNQSMTTEEIMRVYIYASQTLLPLGMLLWGMAYLQVWIDSDGEEMLRSVKQGQHSVYPNLFLLVILYSLANIPSHLLALAYQVSNHWQYLRVFAVYIFFVGVLYLLSLLLRSVTIAACVLFIYLFLASMSPERDAYALWNVLRPHELVTAAHFQPYYLVVLSIGVLITLVAVFYEKCRYHFA